MDASFAGLAAITAGDTAAAQELSEVRALTVRELPYTHAVDALSHDGDSLTFYSLQEPEAASGELLLVQYFLDGKADEIQVLRRRVVRQAEASATSLPPAEDVLVGVTDVRFRVALQLGTGATTLQDGSLYRPSEAATAGARDGDPAGGVYAAWGEFKSGDTPQGALTRSGFLVVRTGKGVQLRVGDRARLEELRFGPTSSTPVYDAPGGAIGLLQLAQKRADGTDGSITIPAGLQIGSASWTPATPAATGSEQTILGSSQEFSRWTAFRNALYTTYDLRAVYPWTPTGTSPPDSSYFVALDLGQPFDFDRFRALADPAVVGSVGTNRAILAGGRYGFLPPRLQVELTTSDPESRTARTVRWEFRLGR